MTPQQKKFQTIMISAVAFLLILSILLFARIGFLNKKVASLESAGEAMIRSSKIMADKYSSDYASTPKIEPSASLKAEGDYPPEIKDRTKIVPLFESERSKYYAYENSVYFNNQKIIGAHAATFELIGAHDYSRDISLSEFTLMYSRDKNHIYYGTTTLNKVDLLTFQVIPVGKYEQVYAKDAQRVFYHNLEIVGADPKYFVSFLTQPYEGVGFGPYGKDRFHAFYGAKMIKDADLYTFKVVGAEYASDETHVYSEGTTIPGASPSTYKFPEFGLACLAKGTLILMSNGSSKGIEDIVVGDEVTSFDTTTQRMTIDSVTRVIHRFDPLVVINDRLKVAPDEVLYLINRNTKQAKNLAMGDVLFGDKMNGVPVISLVNDEKLSETFDLILASQKTFFANGYMVKTPDLFKQ